MLLPALILVGIFLILPAVWVLYIGMTNETLTGRHALNPEYIGFKNFIRIFKDRFFYNSLRISLLFVMGSAVIGQAGLGMALALMTHRRSKRLRALVQAISILPWIIPEVVVAYLWIAFLDKDFGTFNLLMSSLGFQKVNWFHDHPLISIIVFNTWRGTAFSYLLFSAALETIPPSYIEAAEVMNVPWWRRFKDIIFPSVRAHVLTDLILITLWTFNVFTPYLLTHGGPAFKTELLPIYIYRNAFKYFKLGYGAAISTVVLGINLLLAMFYLRLMRRVRRT